MAMIGDATDPEQWFIGKYGVFHWGCIMYRRYNSYTVNQNTVHNTSYKSLQTWVIFTPNLPLYHHIPGKTCCCGSTVHFQTCPHVTEAFLPTNCTMTQLTHVQRRYGKHVEESVPNTIRASEDGRGHQMAV